MASSAIQAWVTIPAARAVDTLRASTPSTAIVPTTALPSRRRDVVENCRLIRPPFHTQTSQALRQLVKLIAHDLAATHAAERLTRRPRPRQGHPPATWWSDESVRHVH